MPIRPLSSTVSVILGTVVGAVFFLAGYLLCVGDHESYGVAMFLLMPALSGLAIAVVVKRASLLASCCVMAMIIGMGLLVGTGFEGYICVLMALPIVIVSMAFGALLGYFARQYVLDEGPHEQRSKLLLLLVIPFVMAASHQLERPTISRQRIETFSSQIHVETSPPKTWKRLARMPHMMGEQPLLLRAGLPVPYQCTLDVEAVGGIRTCHFNQGIIRQQVTEWQPPRRMEVDIVESTLPGRKWLTFVDASYDLIPEGEGTRVVRRSTIASRLYPRWYWRPFEAWGVQSEHTFVLSTLAVAGNPD